MPFLPMCTRGRAEVKQAALPTVTAQHEDAGKCDHSIRSSINKGTSEHCLETWLLPPCFQVHKPGWNILRISC